MPRKKAEPKAPAAKERSKRALQDKKAVESAGEWIHENCTKAELAILLNMAMRNVSDQAARGILVPSAKRGLFRTLPSLHNYIDRLRETAAGRHRPADMENPIQAAKLKTETIEAEIAGMKLAQMKGEMLSLEEITESWSTFAALVKARVLTIPTAARSRLPHLTEFDQVELREIVTEILSDLADEVEASVIGGEAVDVKV